MIKYPAKLVIPNRFKDGYGVSSKIVKDNEANLIITVDNGIGAFEACKTAKQKGVDIIITDHHKVSKNGLPDAFSIVNPQRKDCTYPFKEICGAFVVWLFLAQLKKELKANVDMSIFLELLALATIADVMSLKDINRAVVKAGLKKIELSKRPCFVALKNHLAKSYFSSEDIAFQISPRLNATGRLYSANISYDFLRSENMQEAFTLLEEINNINEERKDLEKITSKEAKSLVEQEDDIIVLASKNWHEGILGIVASRLSSLYLKPSIVLNIENGVAKGSARSLEGIDLFYLISKEKDLLLSFGGHSMACGLKLDVNNLELFKQRLNTHIKNENLKVKPDKDILGELNLDDVDVELVEMIESFEPFGKGNKKPKFKLQNEEVLSSSKIGAQKQHLSLMLKDSKKALMFNSEESILQGDKINATISLHKNTFKGSISADIFIEKLDKVEVQTFHLNVPRGT